MHEVSIVSSIMRTFEVEFEEVKLDKLSAIYLKVGTLSNIEPRLLHNAFTAKNYCGTRFHDVKLHIESTSVKILCEKCDVVTDVVDYKFYCDVCKLPSKNLIQGEEMLIHKVEFDD